MRADMAVFDQNRALILMRFSFNKFLIMDAVACTDSPTQWAALVITLISINVTWWLLDIPFIWKYSFRQYMRTISWQCFRLYMPSLAGFWAVYTAKTNAEMALIYYTGPFYDVLDGETKTPTWAMARSKLIKCWIMDSLTIIATGFSINAAINIPLEHGHFETNAWISHQFEYPTLPPALIGIWLLICARVSWSRIWTLVTGVGVMVIAGVSIAAPMATLSPAMKENQLWIAALAAYLMMAVPMVAVNDWRIWMLIGAYSTVIRVGSIAFSLLGDNNVFPFCPLRSKAFGIIYLTVGCIGGALAVWGRRRIRNWSREVRGRRDLATPSSIEMGASDVESTSSASGTIKYYQHETNTYSAEAVPVRRSSVAKVADRDKVVVTSELEVCVTPLPESRSETPTLPAQAHTEPHKPDELARFATWSKAVKAKVWD